MEERERERDPDRVAEWSGLAAAVRGSPLQNTECRRWAHRRSRPSNPSTYHLTFAGAVGRKNILTFFSFKYKSLFHEERKKYFVKLSTDCPPAGEKSWNTRVGPAKD